MTHSTDRTYMRTHPHKQVDPPELTCAKQGLRLKTRILLYLEINFDAIHLSENAHNLFRVLKIMGDSKGVKYKSDVSYKLRGKNSVNLMERNERQAWHIPSVNLVYWEDTWVCVYSMVREEVELFCAISPPPEQPGDIWLFSGIVLLVVSYWALCMKAKEK